MTFVPVERVEQVWEAAMGLKIDGERPGTEIAEAGDLLEEATELLAKARTRAAVKVAADKAAAAAGVAKRAARGGRTRASNDGAKPGAKEPKPALKAGAASDGKAPKPGAGAPKPAPSRRKGGAGSAKKTTAARGRSGRKR